VNQPPAAAEIFTDFATDPLAGLLSATGREALRAAQVSIGHHRAIGGTSGTIGAITRASSAGHATPMTSADHRLPCDCGRRAGKRTAVESGIGYTERHAHRPYPRVGRCWGTESAPEITGLELEALYARAGELNDAARDFYESSEEDEAGCSSSAMGAGKGRRKQASRRWLAHAAPHAAMLGKLPTQMLDTLHPGRLAAQPGGADMCQRCLVNVFGFVGETPR